MERFGARASERDTSDQHIMADSPERYEPTTSGADGLKLTGTVKMNKKYRGQYGTKRSRRTPRNTHNATQHIGFIWVLVFHTEINQDGCFILLNCVAEWGDESIFLGKTTTKLTSGVV